MRTSSMSKNLDIPLTETTGDKDMPVTFSVHQAIYDLLREKGLPERRNQAIHKSFDEVWKITGSRYKAPNP